MLYRISGVGGFFLGGGGGGGGIGAQIFCTYTYSPNSAAPCSNWMSCSTISEFYKFYSPFGIADKFFYLVNLVGHVKMH